MLAARPKWFLPRFQQLRFIGVLMVCAFLFSGCDPAVFLRPIDWKETSPMVHATQMGAVELQAHDVGGGIGATFSELDLKIVNPQQEVFFIEGARLRTKGEEYAAKAGKVYKCCSDPDDVTRQVFLEV